ncbi:hypothetical protein MSSAC_2317 [Methanosarcina siciliae C2J]|uniref:Uncharacterized protein n=1 Tax=Methanosarcina siciliae C2J TaxID=1434118 RepID=A0A0E3PP15_9EURY|nr:hypothetical protein [Methanosarcina siciliae]AKB36907.1 hypothetical protein MSSAC_2317 [Methanosarcina siciliae C2J]
MKTGNLLFIWIMVGLVLFGFFEFLEFDPIYGGIIGAIIVGTLIGKIIGKGKESVKYAFFSIFTYNLIAWIIMFLFTSDGKLVLQSEGSAVSVFIGSLLVLLFFYSMIGSFGAFVTCSLSGSEQG